jgi:hypothetical protein
MTTNQKFNYVIFYWVGYFIFICFYLYLNKIGSYRNSEKVKAVVVDELFGASRRRFQGEAGYYPQFQFSYKDSVYISADKLVWVRNKNVGQTLTVIFPIGKPDEAVAYTFFSYWVSLPKLLVSFMIAFFIFVLPILWGQYESFKKEYRNK